MVDALEVRTLEGDVKVVEYGVDRCSIPGEVNAYVISVDEDTPCDVCGRPIGASAVMTNRTGSLPWL